MENINSGWDALPWQGTDPGGDNNWASGALSGLGQWGGNDWSALTGFDGDAYLSQDINDPGGGTFGTNPAFLKYLQEKGYTAGQRELDNNMFEYSLFGNDGNKVGNSQFAQLDNSGDLLGIASVLSPMVTGGVNQINPGASFFENPLTQKIFNQALTGAGISGVTGNNPLVGGLQGAVSAGVNNGNVAGSLGFENPGVQSVVNKSISGGVNSALGGGNAFQGAVTSAAPNVLGQLFSSFGGPGEMPDVGTLGGTYADASGENSATMGGFTSPTQLDANYQAVDTGQVPRSMLPQMKAASAVTTADLAPGVSGNKPPAWAQGLSGVFGIYSALDNMNRNRRLFNNLQGMFGANSSYAKQLRQKLERQDAARGRRSDYAGRQTQLDAALAQGQMQVAPALANIGNAQNQGLMSLFNNALKLGTNEDLGNWLGGLFKG